jgi:hypothetical protein
MSLLKTSKAEIFAAVTSNIEVVNVFELLGNSTAVSSGAPLGPF